MDKIIASLKNKKFRYGAFSTLLVVFVLAIIVVINLVVGQFDIKYDLTINKMYSITDTSIKLVQELTEDITIYALFKTGQENKQFQEMLEQYSYYSNRVKVVYRDPYLYPQFVDRFKRSEDEAIAVNSVIVESAKRFKVVPAADMVTYTFNYETFQNDLTSIDFEPQVTNAIKYCAEESTPVIYVITGHNEMQITESFMKQMMLGNYDFKDLNLFTETAVPDDASLLFIPSPERDWSPDEADKVRNYLNDGGSALFIVDIMTSDFEFPSLRGLLNSFGVDAMEKLIYEANPRNLYQGHPLYLLPNQALHEITDPIRRSGYPNLIIAGTAVEVMNDRRLSINIEPLLTTSADAYAKIGTGAASVNKEPGDADGPFNVAVAVSDYQYVGNQNIITKMVVIGSSFILDSSADNMVMGANSDLILNSVNWLAGSQSSIYVRSKSPSTGMSYLVMDGFQGLLITLTSMVFIPLLIIGTGVTVWLRRRNR